MDQPNTPPEDTTGDAPDGDDEVVPSFMDAWSSMLLGGGTPEEVARKRIARAAEAEDRERKLADQEAEVRARRLVARARRAEADADTAELAAQQWRMAVQRQLQEMRHSTVLTAAFVLLIVSAALCLLVVAGQLVGL